MQRKPSNPRRDSKKQARRAENQRVQLNEPRDSNQKPAIATSNGPAVEARSGLQPAENRSFENCAEAELYVTLLARSKNPKEFVLTTYGADQKVAPPCKNCAQWVQQAFRRRPGG